MDLIETIEGGSALRCCDETRAARLRATGTDHLDAAGEVLRTLASPMRLRLLDALGQVGELCVCDAAWICDASDALTSHHLKALATAGLVERRREGRLAMFRLSERGEQASALITELAS
jgi:DNA-binding transcriptional ArsR family regulator